MANDAKAADSVETLLRRSADVERRLLKRERRAELEVEDRRERLAEEQARLDRALARVERRRAEFAVAVAELRSRQAARAAGPGSAESIGTAPIIARSEPGKAAVIGRDADPTINRTSRGKGMTTP